MMTTTTRLTKVDVLIVGGGPGGLALANSVKLHVPNLTCKVVERASSTRAKGAGLVFHRNGLAALKAISAPLFQRVTDACCRPVRTVAFNMEGGVDWEAQLSEQDRMQVIGWSELRVSLMQQLPEGVLQLGCPFTRYEVREEGVEVHFGEGQPPVMAGVVVGCDGYQSRVRQQWLQDGPPSFAGAVILRGRLKAEDTPELGRLTTSFHARGGSVMVAYPASEEDVVWTVSVTVEELAALGLSHSNGGLPQFSVQNTVTGDLAAGELTKQRALTVAQTHPPPLRAIINSTDPSVILEHDITLRPLAKYPQGSSLGATGPITLIGDAAHAIRPTGQGTNMVLEDAVDLTRQLQLHGATEAALRAYEASRLPRWRIMAAHSEARGKAAYGGSVDKEQLRSWEQELCSFVPAALVPPVCAASSAAI